MVVQRFCRAYMESPPPAVFHYKYQSYKYERNTAGKSANCIRAPPRRGRYWEIHPRRPKDFPRPERFPEGEARGKSRGSREIWRAEGMDFPIPPEFWWSTDNLSASIFLQGVDQKILPCGQGRIDSVKINPSLLMMTDCVLHSKIKRYSSHSKIKVLYDSLS